MAFATRADLLARSNARRLGQLAVPADVLMPPVEALRAAIAGGDLSGYSAAEQEALVLALEAIDKALADADALLLSYGVPSQAQSTILARLSSTIALYYLQGAERMTEEVRRTYEGVIATLKSYARGEIDLVPASAPLPAPAEDEIIIESRPSRYGRGCCAGDDW